MTTINLVLWPEERNKRGEFLTATPPGKNTRNGLEKVEEIKIEGLYRSSKSLGRPVRVVVF